MLEEKEKSHDENSHGKKALGFTTAGDTLNATISDNGIKLILASEDQSKLIERASKLDSKKQEFNPTQV